MRRRNTATGRRWDTGRHDAPTPAPSRKREGSDRVSDAQAGDRPDRHRKGAHPMRMPFAGSEPKTNTAQHRHPAPLPLTGGAEGGPDREETTLETGADAIRRPDGAGTPAVTTRPPPPPPASGRGVIGCPMRRPGTDLIGIERARTRCKCLRRLRTQDEHSAAPTSRSPPACGRGWGWARPGKKPPRRHAPTRYGNRARMAFLPRRREMRTAD